MPPMSAKEKGKQIAHGVPAPQPVAKQRRPAGDAGAGPSTAPTGAGRKRPRPGVLQFIDDAAFVADDDEIDSQDEDDAEDDFVDDNDALHGTTKSHYPPILVKEEQLSGDELETYVKERHGHGSKHVIYDDVHGETDGELNLDTAIKEPTIWKVKCTVGHERHIVFCFMQKFVDLKDLGTEVPVVSAFALDHVRGHVYIESQKACDVTEACKGFVGVYASRISLVPATEVPNLLSYRKKFSELSPGAWVRLRNGNYKGDLAQVVTIDEAKRRAMIKLVPRVDLQAISQKFGGAISLKGAAVPAPRLISQQELDYFRPHIESRRDRQTGDIFEVLDGLMFKDGLLYKRVTISSLILWGVQPSDAELLKFTSSNDDAHDMDWVSNVYDSRKKVRLRKPPNLKASISKVEDCDGFKLHDLVFFRKKDIGVIVAIDKDGYFRILQEGIEGPELVTINRQEIKKGCEDKMFTSLDQHKKTIAVGDMVKVLEGTLQGREGVVKHMFKGTLFVYNKDDAINFGFFCVKSILCVNAKYVKTSESGFGENMGEDSTGLFSGPSTMSCGDDSTVSIGRHRRSDREQLFSIGQTLRINKGPLKGYLCRVIRIRRNDVTVKLDSLVKIITVEAASLSIPNKNRGDSSSAASEFLSQDLSPMGTMADGNSWDKELPTFGSDGWKPFSSAKYVSGSMESRSETKADPWGSSSASHQAGLQATVNVWSNSLPKGIISTAGGWEPGSSGVAVGHDSGWGAGKDSFDAQECAWEKKRDCYDTQNDAWSKPLGLASNSYASKGSTSPVGGWEAGSSVIAVDHDNEWGKMKDSCGAEESAWEKKKGSCDTQNDARSKTLVKGSNSYASTDSISTKVGWETAPSGFAFGRDIEWGKVKDSCDTEIGAWEKKKDLFDTQNDAWSKPVVKNGNSYVSEDNAWVKPSDAVKSSWDSLEKRNSGEKVAGNKIGNDVESGAWGKSRLPNQPHNASGDKPKSYGGDSVSPCSKPGLFDAEGADASGTCQKDWNNTERGGNTDTCAKSEALSSLGGSRSSHICEKKSGTTDCKDESWAPAVKKQEKHPIGSESVDKPFGTSNQTQHVVSRSASASAPGLVEPFAEGLLDNNWDKAKESCDAEKEAWCGALDNKKNLSVAQDDSWGKALDKLKGSSVENVWCKRSNVENQTLDVSYSGQMNNDNWCKAKHSCDTQDEAWGRLGRQRNDSWTKSESFGNDGMSSWRKREGSFCGEKTQRFEHGDGGDGDLGCKWKGETVCNRGKNDEWGFWKKSSDGPQHAEWRGSCRSDENLERDDEGKNRWKSNLDGSKGPRGGLGRHGERGGRNQGSSWRNSRDGFNREECSGPESKCRNDERNIQDAGSGMPFGWTSDDWDKSSKTVVKKTEEDDSNGGSAAAGEFSDVSKASVQAKGSPWDEDQKQVEPKCSWTAIAKESSKDQEESDPWAGKMTSKVGADNNSNSASKWDLSSKETQSSWGTGDVKTLNSGWSCSQVDIQNWNKTTPSDGNHESRWSCQGLNSGGERGGRGWDSFSRGRSFEQNLGDGNNENANVPRNEDRGSNWYSRRDSGGDRRGQVRGWECGQGGGRGRYCERRGWNQDGNNGGGSDAQKGWVFGSGCGEQDTRCGSYMQNSPWEKSSWEAPTEAGKAGISSHNYGPNTQDCSSAGGEAKTGDDRKGWESSTLEKSSFERSESVAKAGSWETSNEGARAGDNSGSNWDKAASSGG